MRPRTRAIQIERPLRRAHRFRKPVQGPLGEGAVHQAGCALASDIDGPLFFLDRLFELTETQVLRAQVNVRVNVVR